MTAATETKTLPRLKQRYRDEIVGQLTEQYKYGNPMQIPGLVKVVVNMGVGEAARDSKLIDGAIRDLATITGQKPQVRRATKSIAQFKLREGMPIGAKVTLRNDRMWEFLDRLLTIALRRVRHAVRRPGQLHVRSHGAVDVPRDRPRLDRPAARYGHHRRHHGHYRRRRPRVAPQARLPLQGGVRWRRRL